MICERRDFCIHGAAARFATCRLRLRPGNGPGALEVVLLQPRTNRQEHDAIRSSLAARDEATNHLPDPSGTAFLMAGDTAGGAPDRALILVVERDPHVRDLEAFFLNEAGYEVEFADDGETALAHARETLPRIVITEIMVPKLDGLALCRALKGDEATRGIVVLVFSILAAAGRAREAGADAFLMKPLAEKRLVETVRELMATRAEGWERTS